MMEFITEIVVTTSFTTLFGYLLTRSLIYILQDISFLKKLLLSMDQHLF